MPVYSKSDEGRERGPKRQEASILVGCKKPKTGSADASWEFNDGAQLDFFSEEAAVLADHFNPQKKKSIFRPLVCLSESLI